MVYSSKEEHLRKMRKKHVLHKPIPEDKQREDSYMMDKITEGPYTSNEKQNEDLNRLLDQASESDQDKLNRLIEEALDAMKEASELALKLKAMQLPEKKVPWYKRLFGGK